MHETLGQRWIAPTDPGLIPPPGRCRFLAHAGRILARWRQARGGASCRAKPSRRNLRFDPWPAWPFNSPSLEILWLSPDRESGALRAPLLPLTRAERAGGRGGTRGSAILLSYSAGGAPTIVARPQSRADWTENQEPAAHPCPIAVPAGTPNSTQARALLQPAHLGRILQLPEAAVNSELWPWLLGFSMGRHDG